MKGFTTGLAAAALSLLPTALGHGYVHKAIVGGVEYSGYLPYSDPYYNPPNPRIFRKIPGNGPVEDLSLIDVQCNGWTAGGAASAGSAPATLSATAAAGSTITVYWTQWPDSHKGPLITYMARCPGSCTDYMPGTAAVWFKIHQVAVLPNGQWATTPIEASDNVPFTFQIPASLQPGNYIIRHEILALHAAWAYPGIQSYPSCFQVTVTGSGTAFPTSFVSFPGAYSGSTPGIVYDMYTNGPSTYPFPGPAVWGGGTSGTPPAATSSSTRASSSSSSSTRVSSSTSSYSSTRPASSTSSTRPASSTSTSRATSSSASGGAALYGQCGGAGWTGPTTCAQGTCIKSNDYYSQCLP